MSSSSNAVLDDRNDAPRGSSAPAHRNESPTGNTRQAEPSLQKRIFRTDTARREADEIARVVAAGGDVLDAMQKIAKRAV
jgi:hypothetical protein